MSNPINIGLSHINGAILDHLQNLCNKDFHGSFIQCNRELTLLQDLWIAPPSQLKTHIDLNFQKTSELSSDELPKIVALITEPDELTLLRSLIAESGWHPDGILRADANPEEVTCLLISLIQGLLLYRDWRILNQAFNHASNSIVITNQDGVIEYANAFFVQLAGYSQMELIGGHPALIKSGYHGKDFYKKLWSTVKAGEMWEGVFVNKSKSGELFYEEARIVPLRFNKNPRDLRYLKIGRNVKREWLYTDELTHEAEMAKQLVMSFVPDTYSDDCLRVTHALKAFNYLGGDSIVFLKVGEHRYRYALIDVMGHGLSSALLGIRCITIFHSLATHNTLSECVSIINDLLVDLNHEESSVTKYVSGVFLEIDFNQQQLCYISAGHNDFLIRTKTGVISPQMSNNLLLGVHKGFPYRVSEHTTHDIDRLLLFTDGLLEFDQQKSQEEILKCIIEIYQIDSDDIADQLTSQKDYSSPAKYLNLILGNQPIRDDVAISEIILL